MINANSDGDSNYIILLSTSVSLVNLIPVDSEWFICFEAMRIHQDDVCSQIMVVGNEFPTTRRLPTQYVVLHNNQSIPYRQYSRGAVKGSVCRSCPGPPSRPRRGDGGALQLRSLNVSCSGETQLERTDRLHPPAPRKSRPRSSRQSPPKRVQWGRGV